MAPWRVSDVDRHKSGLTAAQKRQWVAIANERLATCLADGGSQSNCEGSAIRQANGVVGNEGVISYTSIQAGDYQIRQEMHQGEKHIVIPVAMMVEGVHDGSAGPLLHREEDLAAFAHAWSGIPVTVQHPSEDGTPISANNPAIIDGQTVGRVYNTRFEEGKLRGECWISLPAIRRVSPEALAYIEGGQDLEVSVGVFTEDDATPGEWNGEAYTAIARNHRADHLALLPGGVGACSWADGCGIRAHEDNEKGGDNVTDKKETKKTAPIVPKDEASTRKDLILAGFASYEIGYRELGSIIQGKLDNMDDDMKLHYLTEVFEDSFVYEIRPRGDHGASIEHQLYRRNYQVNEDDSVEFTGEPISVVRKVEFVAQDAVTKKGDIKTMTEKKDKTPCPKCTAKAELLIQSKLTKFGEDEREWLMTLDEAQLDKMFPKEPEPATAAQPPEADAEAEGKKDAEKEATPEMNEAQAIKVLEASLADPKKFLKLLPEEERGKIEYGLQLYDQVKEELVKKIRTNTQAYEEAELKGMRLNALRKLAEASKQTVYTGLNAGGDVNEGQPALLPMDVVVAMREAKDN